MAFGDDVPKEMEMQETMTLDRPVLRKDKKYNRQSMSEQLFKQLNTETSMKRSMSQQSLKQDIAMEAMMIDMPSLEGERYDTVKSSSTLGSDDSEEGISTRHFSRWGPVRGSNSYSNTEVPVSQLSTLNLKASIVSDKSKDQGDSAV